MTPTHFSSKEKNRKILLARSRHLADKPTFAVPLQLILYPKMLFFGFVFFFLLSWDIPEEITRCFPTLDMVHLTGVLSIFVFLMFLESDIRERSVFLYSYLFSHIGIEYKKYIQSLARLILWKNSEVYFYYFSCRSVDKLSNSVLPYIFNTECFF